MSSSSRICSNFVVSTLTISFFYSFDIKTVLEYFLKTLGLEGLEAIKRFIVLSMTGHDLTTPKSYPGHHRTRLKT
ncbi:hypothetical protein Hypma_010435 [Hypsizygus marmoreus]|uniref:Uncharacterized protein n=1 Tax=Hypsizygus marmoreus TaxID=39966 RepID=A0A369K9U1_HYPMA|nr:hypothetical protein Hypma_010435 [Hypsizygus marmoreus]